MVIKILIILMLSIHFLFADGLMMPENKAYPKDFLKHRMTRVQVNIHGIIAETIVYQEFEN